MSLNDTITIWFFKNTVQIWKKLRFFVKIGVVFSRFSKEMFMHLFWCIIQGFLRFETIDLGGFALASLVLCLFKQLFWTQETFKTNISAQKTTSNFDLCTFSMHIIGGKEKQKIAKDKLRCCRAGWWETWRCEWYHDERQTFVMKYAGDGGNFKFLGQKLH